MLKKIIIFMAAVTLPLYAQSNVWTKAASAHGVEWTCPALAYSPATNEFIMTMGTHAEDGANCPYQVQVYTHTLGKFINALPNDTLYGKWADSTGYARNNGRVGNGVFGTYYWAFKSVEGYLRPNMGAYKSSRAYGQRAVSSDNGKIYFYINNVTFTYDPATRLWDTVSTAVHPNSGGVESYLKWGSLCYDPHNQEVLLFGGGAADKDSGHVGTWTFKPSTGAWTKLNLSVQPLPRAHTSMAYDPANRVIVLFGGDHLDYYFGDTWIYDCANKTWTQRHPSMNPRPRAGHTMLYLPKSGKMVMAGGYSSSLSPSSAYEIWTYHYSSNAWGLIKRFSGAETFPRTTAPKNTSTGYVAVDTSDVIVALADSAPSFWYFHPMAYKLTCDASQIDAAGTTANGLARDSIQYRSDNSWEDPVWFTAGVAAPDTAASEAFLRGLTLNTWYKISQPKVPGGAYRAWSSTCFDSDRGQFLKFGGGHVAHCGTDVDHYNVHTNRYGIGFRPEYPLDYDQDNNCRPGPLTFNHRPFMNVHNTHAYDYDVNLHKMVYVGGAHTHIYDPDRMDYDADHIHSTFGGGGYNTGVVQTPRGAACVYGNAYGTNGIYLFDSGLMNWRRLTNTGAALPVFYADNSGAIYDYRRDRLIIAQGNSSATANLWSFSFETGVVAQLNAGNSTIATGNDHYRDVVYLPNIDKVVFGIRKTQGHLAYDCASNAWEYYPIALDASVSNAATLDDRGAGYMYDASRNLVWVSDHSLGVFAMRPDAQLSGISKAGLSQPEITGVTASPNPFRPAVTIRLTGALKTGATVKVFDLSGRLVANLSGKTNDGRTVWNAAGHASGVYLVVAQKGKLSLTKKIVCSR